jgi:transcriptional antiterminator NusG|tara:strand:- start:8931 stop:9431 length:501 start_codon:yes stop_codon:yes gene_type:complete
MSNTPQSRFFAIKTTGGQEKNVVNMSEIRVKFNNNRKPDDEQPVDKMQIYSIILPENQKGYVYVEAPNAQSVGRCITGMKHVKNIVPGIMQFSDIDKLLITTPSVEDFAVNDLVVVTSGPFKRMNAKIEKLDTAKSEVTIGLLDSPYPLPVTVSAMHVKLVQSSSS